MMIDDKQKAEVSGVIRLALVELEECCTKIKKSRKILQYKDQGTLVLEMYTNIISVFALTQILEYSAKSKMINDSTGKPVSRINRFKTCVDVFKQKFEYIYRQHLENFHE